ncbi:MAG: ABC transporter ATP-binding protein/permease [Clostridia bacterium]|nr:ABC transporter ATP-binding protein/permease [Clostridia bacterium]
MLKLVDIKKEYITGDNKVEALKGINIEFRKSEFVSILGQSGCGKTTLLNIIGGLDRYTTGDLIINGKSTKKFKNKDWDAYRNYSIGFVFQSYNLIPHQTVLSNVELALTISGVSKKERKQRAIKALEDVGLKEQIHKKPNQLSGGQMQRVAIARALVNNPDIILADEPTGALDTQTSKQVMEILKEISKDKLIVMVTHNPELAEKYSTRVVKILDGLITDDSNPFDSSKEKEEVEAKNGRTSMKFLTALHLSLNNLMTKKGRTLLTAFGGSIGIIGIALILAISTGVQNYINKVEEDTLSSYPLMIQKSSVDIASMMEVMMGSMDADTSNQEEGKIYSSNIMDQMLTTLSNKRENNNLEELKKYLADENNDITKYSNAIQYTYDLKINLYNPDTENEIIRVNPSSVLNSIGLGETMEASNNSGIMDIMGSSMTSMSNTDIWKELLDNQELLKSQNDLLAGKWPEAYNEVVIMVDKDNQISDYALYSLGLKSPKEVKDKWKAIENQEKTEESEQTSYTYDDLLNLKYKLILNSDYYAKENGLWIDKTDDDDYMRAKINDAEEIKVVGIIRPNNETVVKTTTGGVGYTSALKEYVIKKCNEAEIVKEQIEAQDKNVFSGLDFPKDTDEKFDYNALSQEQRMALMNLNTEQIAKMMEAYTNNKNATFEKNMKKLGAIDLDDPSGIYIYPKDFVSKDKIANAIEDYNKKQKDNGKEENVINYSDVVGVMMKSVTQIVNTISYVLIAFVAISLVVSSIMIGIITYISVLERTKEIGILRAIGASKKDISRVFNAETFIVGLISGLIGIGITILLTIPINAVIYAITGVSVHAMVPFGAGVALVAISMILTIIAGLIPAKMASKKDPVIALRTE